MRTAIIRRETKETQIQGSLKIDGRGQYDVRPAFGSSTICSSFLPGTADST